MNDAIEKAKKIAEKLLNRVSDIDLILLYGGLALGREHLHSDYDMIAIIDNKEVKWEFVLDKQPICLWSMTWKDIEEVTTGKDGKHWSIGVGSLAKAVIVYYRDEINLNKFNNLKERVSEGGTNALKQAIANFDSFYGQLWRLEKYIEESSVLELTFLKWQIIIDLNCTLSALNKNYFLNNWGKQFQEIINFDILPVEYVSRAKKFLKSEPKKALKIASELVEDVRTLLKERLRSGKKEVNTHKIASGWSGVIEYLNKSKSAEEKNNLFAGLYAACDNAEYYLWAFQLLQNETWKRNSFYSVQEGLSRLPEEIAFHITHLLQSQDLTELKHSTVQLANHLEEELLSRGATLPIAKSLDDSEKFIRVKTL